MVPVHLRRIDRLIHYKHRVVTQLMEIENWWNEVKNCKCWSGAVQGLAWNDLWLEAQQELISIYHHANLAKVRAHGH